MLLAEAIKKQSLDKQLADAKTTGKGNAGIVTLDMLQFLLPASETSTSADSAAVA